MFDRLIKTVCGSTDETAGALTLEDVSIALAVYDSLPGGDERREAAQEAPGAVSRFVKNYAPADYMTEGRRQQPLLRHCVQTLVSDGLEKLHRNELDVLFAAWTVSQRLPAADRSRRLMELVLPLAGSIAQRRKGLDAAPGLVGLEDAWHFVSGLDIRSSPTRSIRSFAGIDLPSRGPVLSISGNVKVMDSVPEESSIVVEGGACTVGGYVLGRVAARSGCEVRDNIGGVVVVREGVIRARGCVTGAYIVSKLGDVVLRFCENPRLVYGGESIKLREGTRAGEYVSPTIEIAGIAEAGLYVSSRCIRANRFATALGRKTEVVLRTRLAGADYGEYVDEEAGRLLSRIAGVRRKRRELSQLIAMSRDECEHFATSVMVFLLGGDSVAARIEDISVAQRRLGFLDRVIGGLETLTSGVEERVLRTAKRVKLSAEVSERLMDDFNDEFGMIDDGTGVDDDLAEERDGLVRLANEMTTRGLAQLTASAELPRLRDKRVRWIEERSVLAKEIRAREDELRKFVGHAELLESTDPSQSKIQMMTRLLSAARKRPATDGLSKRASARFVAIMLRKMEIRRERIRDLAERLAALGREQEDIRARLLNDFSMNTPDAEDKPLLPASVTAAFGAGVLVCTEHFRIVLRDAAAGSWVSTPDTQGREISYELNGDEIREVGAM